MPLRRRIRSLLARVARPALGSLDRRFDAVAARIERHTTNLSDVQLEVLARHGQRADLDAAVVSEHLIGMERLARSFTDGPGDRIVIAQPGEQIRVPSGMTVERCAAYSAGPDGSWHRVDDAGESSLRIARIVERVGD